MRCNHDVRIHRFIQSTFLQEGSISVHRGSIHPLLCLFTVIEHEGDFHVFSPFRTVAEYNCERQHAGVLAVAFDQFVKHRLGIVPLPGVNQTQCNRQARTYTRWFATNKRERQLQRLVVEPLCAE